MGICGSSEPPVDWQDVKDCAGRKDEQKATEKAEVLMRELSETKVDPAQTGSTQQDAADVAPLGRDLGPDASQGLEPVKPNPGKFLSFYELPVDATGRERKPLGEGNYAKVKFCTEKGTGRAFAVKCIDDNKLEKEDRIGLKIELSLLRQLNHPNIIFLKDYFYNKKKRMHYVVTELLEGGELFTSIVERDKYTESDAREAVKVIAKALDYCHDRGVVHRDLKPENVMLDKKGPDATLKLIDFGFAKMQDGPADMLHTACGTPSYVAPEIIPAKGKGEPNYGPGVDVWALGVITYILLCGYPPFVNDDGNVATLFRAIRSGKFVYVAWLVANQTHLYSAMLMSKAVLRLPFALTVLPALFDVCTIHVYFTDRQRLPVLLLAAIRRYYEDDWQGVGSGAKDLINHMLVVPADQRYSIKQVLAHPWVNAREISNEQLMGTTDRLKKFLARRRLKKGISAVVATVRMSRMLGMSSTSSSDGERPFINRSAALASMSEEPETSTVDETDVKVKVGAQMVVDS